MAGQRVLMDRSLNVNGNQVFKELEEFQPVDVSKQMKEAKGGRFGTKKLMVGLDEMNCSYKILGATQGFLSAHGLTLGDVVQVTLKESLQDEDGEIFAMVYDYTGEITAVKESPSKMGELKDSMVDMHCHAIHKTENGVTVHQINLDARIIDFGEGDIMEAHRRNT